MAGLGQLTLSGEVNGQLEVRYTSEGMPIFSFQIIQLGATSGRGQNRSTDPAVYHNVEIAGREMGPALEKLDAAGLIFPGSQGTPGTRFVGVWNMTRSTWKDKDQKTQSKTILRPIRVGLEILDMADRLPMKDGEVVPYEGFSPKTADGQTGQTAEIEDDGDGFDSELLDMVEEPVTA